MRIIQPKPVRLGTPHAEGCWCDPLGFSNYGVPLLDRRCKSAGRSAEEARRAWDAEVAGSTPAAQTT